MNVLVLGQGQGSWAVRGLELGAAIGAVVSNRPDRLAWSDVVVLVKRADPRWAAAARALGKRVVWDALDFWAQPDQNGLGEADALALLRKHIARYRPNLVIGATQVMAAAAGGVYLPHHARPTLRPAPARETVSVVAYEGKGKYLGRWARAADAACRKHGWTFLVNPPDLRDADLVLACRDGEHDGWMCREWKSGVKLVNAIAAGRPVISQDSAAWREIGPDGSLVSNVTDLDRAFDQWADRDARSDVVRRSHLRWRDYALSAIAERYRDLLYRVHQGVAA